MIGLAGITYATYLWMKRDFQSFPIELTRAVVFPSSLFLIISVMIFFNSFVISILALEHVKAGSVDL